MHTTSAIYPVPASGPGALPGFAFDCSCGGGYAVSNRTGADEARRGHVRWHAANDDLIRDHERGKHARRSPAACTRCTSIHYARAIR